ncbi:unnamed protein product [Calypogeia fissa]
MNFPEMKVLLQTGLLKGAPFAGTPIASVTKMRAQFGFGSIFILRTDKPEAPFLKCALVHACRQYTYVFSTVVHMYRKGYRWAS